MKKLIALLFAVAAFSLSHAQQSSTSSSATGTSGQSSEMKCQGVQKECPSPCVGEKSAASMSTSFSNAGASANKGGKKKNKEQCKTSGSNCCEGASKAKAINAAPAEPQKKSEGTKGDPAPNK